MASKASEVILTRYLYNRSNVLISLYNALDANDYDSAVYWAYEIYHSGFEQYIINILLDRVDNKYKNHPKMQNYLHTKVEESPNDESLPATIIKNMFMKNPEISEKNKSIFIVIKEDQIIQYRTIYPEKNIWKHLQNVCKKAAYSIEMEKKEKDKQLHIFREKWLFYASRSPVWKARILEYNGKIDGRKKTIEFVLDNDLEGFYDKYNYEPDEQPLEIQKKCMGII